MSRFLWLHVFGLLLLTVWTATLELSEEKWATKNSAEDAEEGDDVAIKQNKRPDRDPAFAKDTLHRKNPQDNGNSLKELWEMVPLKQREADIK